MSIHITSTNGKLNYINFFLVSSLGLEEEGTLWITFFLSSFVEWSDVSQKFRCKVLDAGLLFDHIKEVTTLKSDSDSKVCLTTSVHA